MSQPENPVLQTPIVKQANTETTMPQYSEDSNIKTLRIHKLLPDGGLKLVERKTIIEPAFTLPGGTYGEPGWTNLWTLFGSGAGIRLVRDSFPVDWEVFKCCGSSEPKWIGRGIHEIINPVLRLQYEMYTKEGVFYVAYEGVTEKLRAHVDGEHLLVQETTLYDYEWKIINFC